jgi:hypothetical protein
MLLYTINCSAGLPDVSSLHPHAACAQRGTGVHVRRRAPRLHGDLMEVMPSHSPYVNDNWAAAAHLAVIGTVAQPAHPVAALNVAAWVEGVLGEHPVLGVHLQAVRSYRHKGQCTMYIERAGSVQTCVTVLGERQASNQTRACSAYMCPCIATTCSPDSHLATQPVSGALGCLASTPALVVPLDGVSLEAAACNLCGQASKQASKQLSTPRVWDLT